MYPSKSFISLYIWSIWGSFLYMVRGRIKTHPFTYQVISVTFYQKTLHIPLLRMWASQVKNQLAIDIWVNFYHLHSIPCLPLCQLLQPLKYCVFVTYFYDWELWVSQLWFLYKVVLATNKIPCGIYTLLVHVKQKKYLELW